MAKKRTKHSRNTFNGGHSRGKASAKRAKRQANVESKTQQAKVTDAQAMKTMSHAEKTAYNEAKKLYKKGLNRGGEYSNNSLKRMMDDIKHHKLDRNDLTSLSDKLHNKLDKEDAVNFNAYDVDASFDPNDFTGENAYDEGMARINELLGDHDYSGLREYWTEQLLLSLSQRKVIPLHDLQLYRSSK